MSYDENDAAWDAYLEALYEEHRGEAVDEFTAERLQSYYHENPSLAEPAFELLDEGTRLVGVSARAACVLAVASSELTIKTAVLKPVVYGLVHSEPVATLVSELATGHSGLDRFRQLLEGIVTSQVGTNIDAYMVEPNGRPVLTELADAQKLRNGVVHRGEQVDSSDVDRSLAVAETLLNRVFPDILTGLGLHLHERAVCPEPKWRCDIRAMGY